MNVLNRITNWLTTHPGFLSLLIVAMILLAAGALVLYLARDLVCDDDPDEHETNSIG